MEVNRTPLSNAVHAGKSKEDFLGDSGFRNYSDESSRDPEDKSSQRENSNDNLCEISLTLAQNFGRVSAHFNCVNRVIRLM